MGLCADEVTERVGVKERQAYPDSLFIQLAISGSTLHRALTQLQ